MIPRTSKLVTGVTSGHASELAGGCIRINLGCMQRMYVHRSVRSPMSVFATLVRLGHCRPPRPPDTCATEHHGDFRCITATWKKMGRLLRVRSSIWWQESSSRALSGHLLRNLESLGGRTWLELLFASRHALGGPIASFPCGGKMVSPKLPNTVSPSFSPAAIYKRARAACPS